MRLSGPLPSTTDEVEQNVTKHGFDVAERTVTQDNSDEVEEIVALDDSDEVEEIVTQDEDSGEDDFSVTKMTSLSLST